VVGTETGLEGGESLEELWREPRTPISATLRASSTLRMVSRRRTPGEALRGWAGLREAAMVCLRTSF
jgi:hypothetical protein